MPVLEAMAAGLPVACSDIPVLHEVAGDGALYFDPLDEEAIHQALVRLANGEVPWEVGHKRAREFTWEKTARATLDYLSGNRNLGIYGYLNAVVTMCAALQFVGLREAWEELTHGLGKSPSAGRPSAIGNRSGIQTPPASR